MGSDDGKKQQNPNAREPSNSNSRGTSGGSRQGVSVTTGETSMKDVVGSVEHGGTAADISTTGRTQVDGSVTGIVRVTNEEQGATGVRVNTQVAAFQAQQSLTGIVADDPVKTAEDLAKILNILKK